MLPLFSGHGAIYANLWVNSSFDNHDAVSCKMHTESLEKRINSGVNSSVNAGVNSAVTPKLTPDDTGVNTYLC